MSPRSCIAVRCSYLIFSLTKVETAQVNESRVDVVTQKGTVQSKWEDINVGDTIKVKRDLHFDSRGFFP
jgi:hypothetical protein